MTVKYTIRTNALVFFLQKDILRVSTSCFIWKRNNCPKHSLSCFVCSEKWVFYRLTTPAISVSSLGNFNSHLTKESQVHALSKPHWFGLGKVFETVIWPPVVTRYTLSKKCPWSRPMHPRAKQTISFSFVLRLYCYWCFVSCNLIKLIHT